MLGFCFVRFHQLLLSFVARIVLAALAMSLSLLMTRWLLDMALVTTGGDGRQSLAVAGIALALLKLAIALCVGGFVYLRTARFLHVLDPEEVGSVNRLLVRLHLAWI